MSPPTPSELGTKTYWTTTYARDLAQHASNPSHTGTTWFADAGAEDKIVAYLDAHAAALGLSCATSSFVDVGCGNGGLLVALRGEGWGGEMVGLDYAAEAVELARRVAGGRGVRFEVWDVLGGEVGGLEWVPEGGFAVVLDKGTLDAVVLGAEGEVEQRDVGARYARALSRLLAPRGLVLLTSCNWTEGELAVWFGDGWEVVGRIAYPTFRFGGATGQSVTSVCYRRVG